jgi:hypothetical protein
VGFVILKTVAIVSHVNVCFEISWDPGCSDDEIDLIIKRDLITWKLKFDWNSMSHNTASRDHIPALLDSQHSQPYFIIGHQLEKLDRQ